MKTIQKTDVFDAWYESLRDIGARNRIQVRIDRAESGNYGDCKPVGAGVSEMRIHYGAGYRVYFIERGAEIIILLAGGTKSGQDQDIKKAIQLAQFFRRPV